MALHGGLLDAPLAIVDLETTGAHPDYSRITEIAVIEVEGGRISAEWDTLVNPETPIPAGIQALTGITDAMVAGAPTFRELAGSLFERLQGRVVVAHNARFDYGFLKREFEREGMSYNARTLCTVRLSRKLYPEHARHNLDAVIARHGIDCSARHRAMGDAKVLWDFLGVAEREFGFDAVVAAARAISKQPALPPAIDRAAIDEVPEAPGVYVFYGEAGDPLYVGKSVSMRTRVMAHFAEGIRSAREAEIAQKVRSIESFRTSGELGALLKEAGLVKELSPAYNRKLRRAAGLFTFVFAPHEAPHRALRLAGGDEIESDNLPFMHGLFRTKRSAMAALRGLADTHGLCLQTLGHEKSQRSGMCFRQQIGRCAGVCCGKEGLAAHHARVALALAKMKLPAWPYRGPVGMVEKNEERDTTDIHVVHNWCYLGTARDDDELASLLDRRARARFDHDHFGILTRYLGGTNRTRFGAAKVIELPTPAREEALGELCIAN